MESTKTEEPFLRHVEKDVLIPKLMREKAKEALRGPGPRGHTNKALKLATPALHAFNHCCKESGFLMVVKCREENAALKECLTKHYTDPAFFEECKQEYIQEKLEFERTGIPAKKRTEKLPTSM